jgi:hypothetical protein
VRKGRQEDGVTCWEKGRGRRMVGSWESGISSVWAGISPNSVAFLDRGGLGPG